MVGMVRGNPLALAGWLALAWGVGAFCEELFFRGYLLSRLEQVFHSHPLGLAVAVVGQEVVFGCLHLYNGLFGFMFAATSAVLFAMGYLVAGRNLWPTIVVHGVWNSLGLFGVYLSG